MAAAQCRAAERAAKGTLHARRTRAERHRSRRAVTRPEAAGTANRASVSRPQWAGEKPNFLKMGFAASLETKSSNFCARAPPWVVKAMG